MSKTENKHRKVLPETAQRESSSDREPNMVCLKGCLPDTFAPILGALVAMNKTPYPTSTGFFGGKACVITTHNLLRSLVAQVSAAAGTQALVPHPDPGLTLQPWILTTSGNCRAHIDSDASSIQSLLICIKTDNPYTVQLLSTHQKQPVWITYTMNTGDFLVFPANSTHRCVAESDNARVILNLLCVKAEDAH